MLPRLFHACLCCLLLGLPAPLLAQLQLRVGSYDNPPKVISNAQHPLGGIFGELLEEIAQAEGWQLHRVPCQWQECLQALQDGRIDLMPDVAWSEERSRVMDFHATPVLYSWSQLYSRKSQAAQSLLDLQGARIAVLQGSVQQHYLAEQLAAFAVQAELVPVASLQEGFSLARDGQVDAAVANFQYGNYRARDYQLHSTPIMFMPARLFYASAKGRQAGVLNAIEARLRQWQAMEDSPYTRILQRWTGSTPQPLIPPLLWWLLASLAALLLVSLAASAWLRQQVREKTRHLQASEERLNTILDTVEACIYIKDRQGRYQYANRKIAELYGMAQATILGLDDSAFFDSHTAAQLRDNDRRVLLDGQRIELEENLCMPGDSRVHVYLTVKLPLRNAQGEVIGLCGISTDISEHKQNQAQIHRLAFYDALTGLPNRRLLQERLQHALAQQQRSGLEGALLFIDLDHFKNINDTLGHAVGDQLLMQVAQRLSSCLRQGDTLARLGGDEFVLMLENLPRERSRALAEIGTVANKLLGTLNQPYELLGQPRSSGASIGIALFSDAAGNPEDLLKRADLAMYEAKSGGRNTLRFFNPHMQAQLLARTQLEADMRRGLAAGEFILHYQAQVDVQGRVVGAEALARWQHPQQGLVAPGAFIPLAESTGLIRPLGRYLLQQACQRLASWQARPELAHLRLAVNVSMPQLHHEAFVEEVLDCLQHSGAHAAGLELELTESLLAEDTERLIERMQRLRQHGVAFTLDDFGTGFSSLSYLKRLPLARLKIDRSFIHDLLDDPNDAAIVRTILALGRSLDLQVVAEGVESCAQHQALVEAGCTLFQGYLFARPDQPERLEQALMAQALAQFKPAERGEQPP